jgi:xanthine dehydrogenase YagT iron-sulfur-binding subunit
MKRIHPKPVPSAPEIPEGSFSAGVSRRAFLKGLGTTAISAATLSLNGVAKELAQANAEQPAGPGPVPVTLHINGQTHTFSLEPRATLLETLRVQAGLTGPKEVCDRASCGACTVLFDGEPVNACAILAIDAQSAEIVTIEGLATDKKLTALQQAFVDKDGLQCGYCSPGFVMTLAAFLRKNPHPTEAEVRQACAGNICRCGSYPHIFAAVLAASGAPAASKLETVHHHALA